MATLAIRGPTVATTTGTTWASTANAVDGVVGVNNATYATLTSTTSGAVATIEIGSFNFAATIGASDTLNSVSVSLRHFENNTGRFASVTFRAFDGATGIGTATTCTLATVARTDTATVAATLAQLRSSTFKITVTITGAASTQSRVESIDYVDVTADYTPLPPAITQAAYRFYADGTETASTALAAQDTGYTADTTAGDVNLQVRVRLQSTNAVAVGATDDWQLQWEKNTSGTWTNVGATLTDSYPESNQSGTANFSTASIGAGQGVAQSFLGNGQSLVQVGFKLSKVNGPTGTINARLWAHSGTYGSGTATGGAASWLATSTNSFTALSQQTPSAWRYFTFDGTYTLVNGTAYCIGVTTTLATGSDTNYLTADSDTTSPTHSGNLSTLVGYGGTTWSTSANDLIFEVYTSGGTVSPYASANLTDAAATTNRLGSGSGSFVAGKLSEDGLVDDLGWSANNYTELLYSVTIKQADVANADTLRFRVLRNGVTPALADSYPSSNGDSNQGITAGGSTQILGQSFLGDGKQLVRAGFLLSSSVAPGGTVQAVLYAHTGTFGTTGVATGSALATSSAFVPPSPITQQWIYFDFDGMFTLAAGTPYVIAMSTTIVVGNGISMRTDASSPTHAGSASRFQSPTWFTYANDVIFEVYTATAPPLTYTATPTVTIASTAPTEVSYWGLRL